MIEIFIKKSSSKQFIYLLCLVVGLFCMALIGSSTAGAFSNTSPNPADMLSGGEPRGISHLLKNEDVAQVTTIRLAAYYPTSGSQRANGKKLTIAKGREGEACLIDRSKVKSGNVFITIRISDGVTAEYTVPIGRVCSYNKQPSQFFKDYAFPAGNLIYDEAVGKYRANINISYGPGVPMVGSDENSVNFLAILGEAPGTPSAEAGVITPLANADPRQYGLRSAYFKNENRAHGVQAAVEFGYPCHPPSGGYNKDLFLYDADKVFGETRLWVTKNGARLARGDYTDITARLTWNNAGYWEVEESNRAFNRIQIASPEPGVVYKFVIQNTGAGGGVSPSNNVLSVSIPHDPIYSRVNCAYRLDPTIALSPTTYSYFPNLTVGGSVVKNTSGGTGPPGEHNWQVLRVKYTQQPPNVVAGTTRANDDNPCNNVNDVIPTANRIASSCQLFHDNTSSSFTASRTDRYAPNESDPPGTRLCFITRVKNPTHLPADDNSWRYSDLKCALSSKSPKVQILGSDLKVNGLIDTSVTEMRATDGTFKMFGSWIEYGVFSKGANALASSGAGLKEGNSSTIKSEWSRLTFANRTEPYGRYDPLPGVSNARAYFDSLTPTVDNGSYDLTKSGVYKVGNINLSGSIPTSGTSVIIQSSGTVTIDNSITVNNSNLTRARDISQIVIIADKINIKQNVANIDAWLITRPAGGGINTCSDQPATLTTAMCNNLLTVNGAVVTDKINLRRTHGADDVNPGAAAEIMRLRPDSQLWAFNYANKGDRAQTVYLTELPPRY